jgi:DNA-binding MarR family transcriptional regulator
MSRHDTDEQVLYRGVSMARNLAHLGQHDEAAIVAEIAVKAYREQNYRPDEAPRAVADGGDDVDRGEGVETDGGHARLADLSGFQRDLLVAFGKLDETDALPANGQEVQTVVEAVRDERVTHGRHYPNLDALAEAGLIDKHVDAFSRRAHGYSLTDAGRAALDERLEQLADATGQRVMSAGAAYGGRR